MAESKLPKGPSNSAGMGATPGTQQTAMNNVRSMNINPNMPVAPQLAKQSRSSFQKSLEGTAGMPAPKPVQPAPMAPKPAPKVVSQAMPMDQGRGYNIFSGMDANQITSMNQSMGLSNMTSLPAVAPQINPALFRPPREEPQQLFNQVTSSTDDDDLGQETTFYDANGVVYEYDPETGTVQQFANGEPVGPPKSLDSIDAEEGSNLANWIEGFGPQTPSSEELLSDAIESEQEADKGADPVKLAAGKSESEQKVEQYKAESEQKVADYKAEAAEKKQQAFDDLDDAYAIQLQTLLSGIDRQMAMAGMTGSGAHSAAVSGVASQVLQGLLNEYNELNKQEIDAVNAFSSKELDAINAFSAQELSDLTGYNILDLNFDQQDEQEYFQNMLAASQLVAQKESLEEEDINEILNVGEFLNSTITDDLNSYIQGDLNNTDPVAKQAYLAILADIQFELMQKAMPPNAELTVEEAVSQYTAAADLLSQAMIAHVTQSKTNKSTADVMQHLTKLEVEYGIELPSIFDDFKQGIWQWAQ